MTRALKHVYLYLVTQSIECSKLTCPGPVQHVFAKQKIKIP